jgi:hypothetical protein
MTSGGRLPQASSLQPARKLGRGMVNTVMMEMQQNTRCGRNYDRAKRWTMRAYTLCNTSVCVVAPNTVRQQRTTIDTYHTHYEPYPYYDTYNNVVTVRTYTMMVETVNASIDFSDDMFAVHTWAVRAFTSHIPRMHRQLDHTMRNHLQTAIRSQGMLMSTNGLRRYTCLKSAMQTMKEREP